MNCKVCGGPTVPLFASWDGAPFHRCQECGSDSSALSYEDVRGCYTSSYVHYNENHAGGRGVMLAGNRENAEWFGPRRERFLDIGSCEGCAMEVMAERGWECWGFDVIPECKADRVVIGSEFRASLFPHTFDAVQAREVLEHVEDWRSFLHNCWLATAAGGLFQVQTPRPGDTPHHAPYQRPHLQLFSPLTLRSELEKVGFQIVKWKVWPLGQRWLCRRTDHG